MKVKNMTVQELLDMGATVEVNFFDCSSESDATEKLAELTVKDTFRFFTTTLKDGSKAMRYPTYSIVENVRVTAFYDSETEPEHA